MLSAYFSHSWKAPHLPINLALWNRISKHCQLLIDQPVQELHDQSPPWFISRIESLLRRSDVFLSCLPYVRKEPAASQSGDWRLCCSPYMLFELRLAERANLPRFVLYDSATLLRPPAISGPHVRYLPCKITEVIARLERGVEDTSIVDALESWLAWLDRNLKPRLGEERLEWAYLLGTGKRGSRLRGLATRAAAAAGFGDPVDLSSWTTDADLCHRLRSLSMLVVDVSEAESLPLYHYAHALLTPSVRLSTWRSARPALPALLVGHPAGYQEDLLGNEAEEKLYENITERARSLIRHATPIVERDEGRYELHQRLYKRHLIFISHDLKGKDRELITAIAGTFREQGIDFWEYEERNRSGENWKTKLDDVLAQMTHYVPLFSTTFEQSPMCMKELNAALTRGPEQVVIRPFLLGDRARPNVNVRELDSAHHQRLTEERGALENARIVARAIVESIRR